MREWTDLAFSSIYYLIKKLEKAGLISASRTDDHGRRTAYALTPEGLTVARNGTRRFGHRDAGPLPGVGRRGQPAAAQLRPGSTHCTAAPRT